MGSLDCVQSLLESLPPRPPTPPRETLPEPDAHLKQRFVCHPLDLRRSLHTPPSVHSAVSAGTGSSRGKKVEFSAQVYVGGGAEPQNPTPPSVPPPSSSKPVKSILKVATCPNPLQPCDIILNGEANLVTMLDSTIQQLAGADRDSKLDAYTMLVRALKASNNLPDRIALQDKMSLFMQFVQRDMTARTAAGSTDSTLIIHSLSLLSTFLQFPAIASTLANDFGVYVVDHCIRSFEDASLPKDVARHLMQVVALQTFGPKVMTSDRVGRLVTALHNIEANVTGKSIIMSRVMIYRKLIKQCKQHMVAHSDWLLDLFTDMISRMKEIRSSAISLGLEAAFALGREKQMTRRVIEVFQQASEDQTYIEFYAGQLQIMTRDKQDSPFVPQIWSAVILLLRVPDKWDYFSSWLRILQQCFNSNDYQTKQEANFAWNRLIYGLHFEERSFSKMIPALVQPLAVQLKRRGTAKQKEDLRRVVLGSACTLFYYAFRPTASLTDLDSYWDSCVKPLVQQLTDRASDETRSGLIQASEILTGFFDCSTPRLWKGDRAAESPLIKPAELPAIDAKWIRRNTPRVFATVEPIIEKSFLDLSDSRSVANRLWRTLVGAVSSAASKEVKVSVDTAAFVGHVLGVILKIWTAGLPETSGNDKTAAVQFLASMREFILIIVESLGLLPFTEKLLSRDTNNAFLPLATPSHRPGKGHTMGRPSFHHLFSILSSLPPRIPDDDDFTDFLRCVFAPFFSAKGERAQMDLAHEMLQLIPVDAVVPYGPWQLVAEKIAMSLDPAQSSHRSAASITGSETPVGPEYRDVVRVLERGLRSTPNLPWSQWQALFCVLATRVQGEAGDAGLAICVIEPLAKQILDLNALSTQISTTRLKATTELLSAAIQPRDRQAVESARRRLWGTAISGARSASFDPFNNLYKLVGSSLQFLYDNLTQCDSVEIVAPLINELEAFFNRSNSHLIAKSVVVLQQGIACWIQDEQTQLNSRQSTAVAESTKTLWDTLCTWLGGLDRSNMPPLDVIEPLLCAAFESKHRHIVNTVSIMWNKVFDQAGEIAYPERLKSILLSRRSIVDLVLPGLEVSSVESGAQQPQQPVFIDSQEDMDVLTTYSAKTDHRTASRPSSADRTHSPLPVKLTVPAKHSRPEVTASSRALVATRSSARRLRHDDSQIQFAAIESTSHHDNADESQVLTERQREVRERQRDNEVIYREIRSSPAAMGRGPSQSVSPAALSLEELPEQRRATTPNAGEGFDDFITSTPTPRRGQALTIGDNDVDMVDPPSSPPEPRRFLLPEIQSRSNSSSILDEWQFSSSPVGSPVMTPSGAPEEPAAGRMTAISLEDRLQPPLDANEPAEHSLQVGSPVLGSVVDWPEAKSAQSQGKVASPSPDWPPGNTATPNRKLRSAAARQTPRSDNKVSPDAMTHPPPSTPKSHQRRRQPRARVGGDSADASEGYSFALSEADERSMLRLVVELDQQTRLSPPTHAVIASSPSSSSEKEVQNDGPMVLDCITVQTEPKRSRGRPPKKSRLSTPIIASTPPDVMDTTSSQGHGRSGKRKRARSSAHAEGPDSKRRSPRVPRVEPGEVPDSQLAPESPEPIQEKAQHPEDDISSELPSLGSPSLRPELGEQDLAGDDPGDDPMEMGSSDLEREVQSQLTLEQQAQDQREKRGFKEAKAETTADDDSEVDENVTQDGAPRKASEAGAEPETRATPNAAAQIMEALARGLNMLRTAALHRDEVYKVEDICMDIRRELYEAERRGH